MYKFGVGVPWYPGISAPPKPMPEIPAEIISQIDPYNSLKTAELSPVQKAPYF